MTLLGPSSVSWRLLGDQRGTLVAGRALIMQVAHPVVGAGVLEHSTFRDDPWKRLDGTIRSLNRLVFGSEARAQAEGARLRAMHRAITGIDAQGLRYRALDPDAYLWVHATLWDSAVAMGTFFGDPLSGEERERFYQEWREVGRRLGIGARRMPEDAVTFAAYIADVTAERLTRTQAVDDVLRTIAHPKSPLPLGAAGPVWDMAILPAGQVLHIATLGTLPPALRRRFGLRWTPAHELELRALATAVRAAWPLVPRALRHSPAARAAWRLSA